MVVRRTIKHYKMKSIGLSDLRIKRVLDEVKGLCYLTHHNA